MLDHRAIEKKPNAFHDLVTMDAYFAVIMFQLRLQLVINGGQTITSKHQNSKGPKISRCHKRKGTKASVEDYNIKILFVLLLKHQNVPISI